MSSEDARNLLNALSESLDLKGFDRTVDAEFVKFAEALNERSITQAFLSDYVGFPVYDVLLYTPGSRELGPDPLTRIRVDRISPEDTDSLSEVFSGLKSRNLMGFLGFFNREYREHDYLWGRLNSANRLVDLLSNVAPDAFDKAEKDRFQEPSCSRPSCRRKNAGCIAATMSSEIWMPCSPRVATSSLMAGRGC